MSSDPNDSALEKAKQALERRYNTDASFRRDLNEAVESGNRSWFATLIEGFLQGIGIVLGAAVSPLITIFFGDDW